MTRKNLLRFAAVSVLAICTAGAIGAAQLGGGLPHIGPFGGGGPGGMRGERMLDFLADYLDLTTSQKDLAKTTMEATRKANEPYLQQLRQVGEQARAAVQTGKSDAELQQIANSIGPLVSQLAASHMRAMKTLYATLNQPQKDKIERLHERFQQRMEQQRQPPQ
jgi:hypothetical protein